MNRQLGDPVYKCSENGNDKTLFLETNFGYINEKSANLLPNSFEVMSFSDDAKSSHNCSSCTHISYSESDENQVLACHVLEEIRSTREKLTFEWVKTMSCVNSQYEFDSSFDCSISSNNFKTDSETDDSKENHCIESSPEFDNDDSVVFMEDSNGSDISELTFCLADVVTEENCDSGFSFSTRGSLINCVDDDFLEDNDFELVFSTSPLSANILTGWNDIISEASELSQGFENKAFVDFFDLPEKSKALKSVNERWKNDMCDVDEKPREPVKVTFAPNLVTVHLYQKSLGENQPYDISALDRLRFQNRIEELSKLLTPILTLEHRANIVLRNSLPTTHD